MYDKLCTNRLSMLVQFKNADQLLLPPSLVLESLAETAIQNAKEGEGQGLTDKFIS